MGQKQTFSESSEVRDSIVARSDIPTTIEEVQQLAHALVLYAKCPNKELAIGEAWSGITQGGSPEWTRASQLFDAAMGQPARAAAKAKDGAPPKDKPPTKPADEAVTA